MNVRAPVAVQDERADTATPETDRRTASRLTTVSLAVLWVLVAAVLQLARQSGVPSYDTMWAEDGAVFLTDALRGPLVETIFKPHGSYLQVIPRLAAALVSPVPVAQAALAVSLAAALVVAALSVFIFWASGSAGFLRTTGARAALAALVVLLPAAVYETNATLSNLHWYFIFAAFWALVARPRSRVAWCLCVAVVVLGVLSDPLAALLLPFVAWRLWVSRSIRNLVLAGAFLASAAAQLVVLITSDELETFAERQLGDIPAAYGLRVASSALIGDRSLGELYSALGPLLPLGFLAVVAAVLAYGLLRRGASAGVIAVLMVASIGYWTVPLAIRGAGGLLAREPLSLNGSRYTIVPVLFLLAALIHVFDRPRMAAVAHDGQRLPERLDAPRTAAAGLLAAVVLLNFTGFNVRQDGPSWTSELADARARCLDRSLPTFAVDADGYAFSKPGEVLVRIAPPTDNPYFRAAVPCNRLVQP